MPAPSQAELSPDISEQDLIALARLNFWVFVELVFPVLHPGQKLVYADYMDLVAVVLKGCATGRRRRVIINMPPRFMKSLLVSILYVAWRIGVDPSAKFICISYGDDLAHKLSGQTRTLMLSSIYRAIFPNTVLEKKSTDHLVTTKGGYRYATAVGSDITGFGADEIIIDDPLQPDEATSELMKQKLRDWVQSSVLTRFNDPSKGVLILVMHRIAPDDLSGTLEATGGYFVLKLPLVAEKLEKFTHKGKLIFVRQPGALLNPSRMSQAELAQLKAEIAPHVFAGQYQQRPLLGGSGICDIGRIRRYDTPPAFELTIHSWDLGATTGGNPTVCTKWGVAREPDLGDVFYLIGLIRIKMELPDVRALIKAQDKLDKPDLIVIDGLGIGIGIYQELRGAGYRHLYTANDVSELSKSGKIERFTKALLWIYDHKVALPKAAPYLDVLLAELAAFPEAATDDQVDSISQVLARPGQALHVCPPKASARKPLSASPRLRADRI